MLHRTQFAALIIAYLWRDQLEVLLRQTGALGGRRAIDPTKRKIREASSLNELSQMGPKEPVVLRNFVAASALAKIGRTELREHYKDDFACIYVDTDDTSITERRRVDLVMNEIEGMDTTKVYARALHDHRGLVHKSGITKCMKAWNPVVHATSPFFERGINSSMWFLSQNNTHSEVHCDVTSSLFVMVEGEKSWEFWKPSNKLLPFGQRLNLAFDSELTKFPEPDLKVTIYPGDILLFPSMWWHRVSNHGSINVGFDLPFIDIPGSLQRHAVLTLATVFNVRAWQGLARVNNFHALYFEACGA